MTIATTTGYVKTLAHIVEDIAPTIAAAMTSPIGGVIVALVEHAFGLTGQAPQDALNTIVAAPDKVIKLQELEAKHSAELATIAYDDTASARELESTLVKLTGRPDMMLHWLATIIAAGFFLTIILIIFYKVNQDNNTVLYTLLGVLGGAFSNVVGFYFGSSYKEKK